MSKTRILSGLVSDSGPLADGLLSAADIGALALAGGTLTGTITFAGAQTFPGTQAALVSGTNIKTVNGNSVLGSGDIVIAGGVTSFNTRTGDITLSSGDVTGALGFTPYSATNPSGYITSSGSITGNAATATTATNQSGGTVNATTGTFSGLIKADSGTIQVGSSAGVYRQFRYDGTISADGTNFFPLVNSSNVGTYALPIAGGTLTGNLIFGNATSPNTNYIQFGDNTGWNFRIMTSVSGTPTVRYTFADNGNFTAVGNVTAYSDERLKKDWAPVAENFVDRLATIKSGTYTRTDSGDRQAGSSAQDWQKLLPEVVMEGTDEYKTLALAYGNAALVAAVELAKELVALKAEVAALKQGK
jgi:hypothetical protein